MFVGYVCKFQYGASRRRARAFFALQAETIRTVTGAGRYIQFPVKYRIAEIRYSSACTPVETLSCGDGRQVFEKVRYMRNLWRRHSGWPIRGCSNTSNVRTCNDFQISRSVRDDWIRRSSWYIIYIYASITPILIRYYENCEYAARTRHVSRWKSESHLDLVLQVIRCSHVYCHSCLVYLCNHHQWYETYSFEYWTTDAIIKLTIIHILSIKYTWSYTNWDL